MGTSNASKTRSLSSKTGRKQFCEILWKNIEDYKRLGYSVKDLLQIYAVLCE